MTLDTTEVNGVEDLMPFLRRHDEGAILEIHVQPKASKSEVVGVHQDCLKVRIAAPPVEGEANKECIRFLSKTLGVPKSSLEIIQGQKSRHKSILIRGITPQALQENLKQKSLIT